MDRRQWFEIHSWVGVKLFILLSFVLLTGTLATVSHEIDWISNPAMRVSAQTQPDQYDWVAFYRAAQQAYPQASINSMAAPIEPWFAPQIVAIDQHDQRFRIFIHPDTHQITGTGRWYNWQRFFRQAHRHLMMPVTIGLTIVCLLSFLLLASAISAMIIYRHWWLGFFRWPVKRQTNNRKQGQKRRWWGELHKLLGVWSLWFILLIAITGVWYLAERWGLAANYPPVPKADSNEQILSGDELQTMLDATRDIYPSLQIRSIVLPPGYRGNVAIQGQADAVLVRNRANTLVFTPGKKEPVVHRRGDQLSAHHRIAEAADPLHFGTFGNWIVRWLWFVFGAFLTALSISGAYLCGLRLAKSQRGAQSVARPAWRSAYKTMGFYRLPGLALVGFCAIATVMLFF